MKPPGPHPDDDRVTLSPEEIDEQVQQLLAEMHGGFSGLMAEHVHDLSGTAGEDDAGQLAEGSDQDGDEQATDQEAEAGGGETDQDAGDDAAQDDVGGQAELWDTGAGVRGGKGKLNGGSGQVKPPLAAAKGKPPFPPKKPPVANVQHRCPACGYEMDEDQWEDEECPNCGEVVNNEQQRAPNGQFGEGDGTASAAKPAGNVLARLSARVDALADKIPVLHQIKDAGKRVTASIHAKLESRYGSRVASVIMGGGFLGGYGVAAGAAKLFAFPGVPFVNDVVAIGVLAGAAEVGLQARRAWEKLTGNAAGLEGIDVDAEREAVAERLAGLVWKQLRQHKAAIATCRDAETATQVQGIAAELKG